MTYKQLKWFILLIPTVTVGVWEYVRHEYLLPYISMDVGNWLTPVIVLFVTFTLLTRFFKKLEQMQEQLRIERAKKAVLEERERIAHDLHDGMAQSLFLLSIKVKQLNELQVKKEDQSILEALNKSIVSIHHYVRTGIENLRNPPLEISDGQACESFKKQIKKFKRATTIDVIEQIEIDETFLTKEEKYELTSSLSEALVNIQKHAQASMVEVDMKISKHVRYITISDNGVGFDDEDILQKDHYGLQMIRERCERINWEFDMKRENGLTIVHLKPKGSVFD